MSYCLDCDHKYFRRPPMPSGIISGLFLIYLGMAFALENLNLIYIEDALLYCPSFLIALGLVRLWNRGVFNFWAHILLSCGILLQAAFLRDFYIIEIWWPALIIWLGITVVFRAFLSGNHKKTTLLSSRECHLHQHNDNIGTTSIVEHEE